MLTLIGWHLAGLVHCPSNSLQLQKHWPMAYTALCPDEKRVSSLMLVVVMMMMAYIYLFYFIKIKIDKPANRKRGDLCG
jgi:hypothetical protein